MCGAIVILDQDGIYAGSEAQEKINLADLLEQTLHGSKFSPFTYSVADLYTILTWERWAGSQV